MGHIIPHIILNYAKNVICIIIIVGGDALIKTQ